MNIDQGKRIRRVITSKIIRGSDIDDCFLLQNDWRGVLLDNQSFYDPESGDVGDADFELISMIATKLYGDEDIYLVTAGRYDVSEEEGLEEFPEVRSAPNTLDGYSQFKKEPGLFEFYMFGASLKWIIYANADWLIVAGESRFFDRLICGYGGMTKYLDKLSCELGLANPAEPMTDTERKWMNFVYRVLGLRKSDIEAYFSEKQKI